MNAIRALFQFLDATFLTIIVLNAIDLMSNSYTVMDSVDGWIKVMFNVVGIGYFVLNWKRRKKKDRIELEIREQELRKLTLENNKNDIENENQGN